MSHEDRHNVQQDDSILEELVAYLDGELDAAQTEAVEQRLAEDAEYRAQMQQLQHTWDLLDFLPQEQAGEEFTKSTVEMVAVSAAGDINQTKLKRSRIWLTLVAAASLLVLASFAAARWFGDQPNRELVRDLPVIENLDLYYHVDDIEFLTALDDAGIFEVDLESKSYAP